jgi:Ca2+-binding EF-hand superfamily protein
MKKILCLALFLTAGAALAAGGNAALISRMEGADTNRDMIVTKPELIAYRGKNFARFDRNSDGYLTRDDIPAFLARFNPDLDFNTLLTQFDSDKDGKVSRAEFVNGPTIIFDAADTNRDGQLTAAERQAAINAAKR